MTAPTPIAPVAHRATASAAWVISARLGTRAIDFVTLLVLTRALTPRDFGIVAIAMTLVQIIEAIFELPVAQVLVRSAEITTPMLQTAFTFGALRGGALGLVLALLAWPFALAYGDPRLVPLILFLSLAPAFRGMVSPGMARFARHLNFRPDAAIEVSGKLAALVLATSFALATRSYWAIAVGTVASPAFMLLASYGIAPMRLRLRLSEWRLFAGFMGWTTAAQAISALNWQADRLIVGRFVPRAGLGLFTMASDLSGLPEQAVVKPIFRPLLSLFALSRAEPDKLAVTYLASAASVFAAGLPVMLGLSILAHPAVRLALGPKWSETWPYLQWMALVLVLPLLNAPLSALAMAEGRADIFLKLNLWEFAVKIPATLIGVVWMGPWGVVLARMLAAGVMVVVSALYVRALLGLSLLRQLHKGWRTFAAGAALAGVLLALRGLLAPLDGVWLGLGLVACALAGLAAYGAALFGLWLLAGRPAGFEATVLLRLGAAIRPRRGAQA